MSRKPRKKRIKSAKPPLPTKATKPANNPKIQIPDDAVEILGSLPEDVQEKVAISLMSKRYSGPLPQASELKKYNEVKQGFAERIVQMAEKEQSHRHEFDDGALRAYSLRGVLSFLLGAGLIAASLVSLYLGYPWQAVSLGLSGVVGTIINAILKFLDTK